jgi:hypothetical protein
MGRTRPSRLHVHSLPCSTPHWIVTVARFPNISLVFFLSRAAKYSVPRLFSAGVWLPQTAAYTGRPPPPAEDPRPLPFHACTPINLITCSMRVALRRCCHCISRGGVRDLIKNNALKTTATERTIHSKHFLFLIKYHPRFFFLFIIFF